MAIVLATFSRIFTFTLLTAIWPVESIRARNITSRAGEAGHTLALSINVITFATIFTHAFQSTIWTVSSCRTRMLTRQAYITGSTNVLTSHMITCFIAVNDYGTLFFATQTISSLRTGLRTVVTGPATIAYAFARLRITR